MGLETGRLFGGEDLGDHLSQGGDARVGRCPHRHLPRGRPGRRLEVHPQLQVDFGEAGRLAVPEQVPLVEVEHRVGLVGLMLSVEGPDPPDQVRHRREVVPPEAGVGPVAEPIAVDGLEEGDATAGPEHPVEGPEGRRFVGDVDEHRTGGDDVHRPIGDGPQVLGGGPDEATAVGHPHLFGQSTGVVQQGLGDVAEDDAPRGTNPFQGTEGDEAIAGPHVEERFPLPDLRVVEDLVADGVEKAQGLRRVGFVPAKAGLDHPPRPRVTLSHGTASPPSRRSRNARRQRWLIVGTCRRISPS